MSIRGPHSHYDFLNEDLEKQEKTKAFRDRYTKHIKNALLIFVAGFGFIILANLPIVLPEKEAYTEAILRDVFWLLALCCWGHGVAFWLSYKFAPNLAGIMSWLSMWVIIPTIVFAQFL